MILFDLKRSTSIPQIVEAKNTKLQIWPEWNDTDLNNEKWDSGTTGRAPRESRKPPSAPVIEALN